MHQKRSVPTAATCVEESGQNGVLHKLNYTEIEEREWLLNSIQANDRRDELQYYSEQLLFGNYNLNHA